MTYTSEYRMQEAYLAPVHEILSLEIQAICQTRLTGGEIEPGEGFDWGKIKRPGPVYQRKGNSQMRRVVQP